MVTLVQVFSVFVVWDAYGNYKASEGYHVRERLAE